LGYIIVGSNEWKKAIEEIVHKVKAQEGQKMGIFVDKMMKIIYRKIKEAENTRVEMKPTIERDFGIDPLPDNFKNFLIDHMEQLQLEKIIKRPDSPVKYNELSMKLEEFNDLFIKQFDLLAEQIDLDALLREYGEWRNKKFHKSECWHDTYNGLIDSGYIDTSAKIFDHVMTHKHLPYGAEKILWRTQKADALYFQHNLKFSMPEFNKCFRSKDGRQFKEGQRPTTRRKTDLQNIIKAAKEKL